MYALRNIEPRSHNHCLPWESNENYIFGVCGCTFSYPTCNSHALYCHLWPVRLYSIFPHSLIIGTILKNTLLNIKCVFRFSLQFLCYTFLVLRRTERVVFINVLGLYSRQILVHLESSRHIVEKLSHQISRNSAKF